MSWFIFMSLCHFFKQLTLVTMNSSPVFMEWNMQGSLTERATYLFMAECGGISNCINKNDYIYLVGSYFRFILPFVYRAVSYLCNNVFTVNVWYPLPVNLMPNRISPTMARDNTSSHTECDWSLLPEFQSHAF